jgi:hypothetical protein
VRSTGPDSHELNPFLLKDFPQMPFRPMVPVALLRKVEKELHPNAFDIANKDVPLLWGD